MIPKKVKIGQVDYTVHLFPQEHGDNYGVCLNHHQRIYLSQNQTWQQAGNTLLHEIMHAIYHQSGLSSIEKLDEEPIVNIMATWVHLVMLENPEAAEFILNAEKHWDLGPLGNPDEEAIAADE
jgi:hypothetical protein